jgi:NAD(P)-dependent dehydrogenase (short-subunit alcohol dehydrogenase family)
MYFIDLWKSSDVSDGQITDDNVHAMLDTNVKAMILCSRLAVSSMKRHFFDGHIININRLVVSVIAYKKVINMDV